MTYIKIDDIKGESEAKSAAKGKFISPSSTAAQRLKKLGMSDAGVRQLSAGQPILNKNDQAIVTRIVVLAIG